MQDTSVIHEQHMIPKPQKQSTSQASTTRLTIHTTPSQTNKQHSNKNDRHQHTPK